MATIVLVHGIAQEQEAADTLETEWLPALAGGVRAAGQAEIGLKAAMIEALRQAKPSRGRRRTTLAGSSMVPETLRIIHRPEEIGARLVPGHWEGDLPKGAFNRSSVGTLVERFVIHENIFTISIHSL